MSKCHCGTRASFNFQGETKGRFCAKHKEPQMVDVKNKHCEADSCNTTPLYNIIGEKKARFCGKHKELLMVDVRHKTCEII